MLLTLKQISSYTHTTEMAIYRFITRHKVRHAKDGHGRIVVGIDQLSSYRPRKGDKNWMIKLSLDAGHYIHWRNQNDQNARNP